MKREFEQYLKNKKKSIDSFLNSFLPSRLKFPQIIHNAIYYSLFPGGKRIRPIFLLTIIDALSKRRINKKEIYYTAIGIELIHNYSLVHDDLPVMDNDDYRRGKLSCHRQFGEAIAVLTGDALLTLGIKALTLSNNLNIVKRILNAIGIDGLIGGQVADILKKDINYIHYHKTACFFEAIGEAGAVLTNSSVRVLSRIRHFSRNIGLTFQLVDDLFDWKEEDALTYPKVFGERKTKLKAERLIREAKEKISFLKDKGKYLNFLADYVLERKK